MVRIQLHLTEVQNRRLRALARKQRSTRAELIRRGIDLLLREGDQHADPLLELIGAAGAADRTDISEHHDEVLYGHDPQPVPVAAEPSDTSEDR